MKRLRNEAAIIHDIRQAQGRAGGIVMGAFEDVIDAGARRCGSPDAIEETWTIILTARTEITQEKEAESCLS